MAGPHQQGALPPPQPDIRGFLPLSYLCQGQRASQRKSREVHFEMQLPGVLFECLFVDAHEQTLTCRGIQVHGEDYLRPLESLILCNHPS